mmetsp:Transcript_18714/g.34864  ORF Transcript_18714/g.34864 Transcript_18714/m.34864 type:complete len:241 (-) Transcript_18714:102-824(-)
MNNWRGARIRANLAIMRKACQETIKGLAHGQIAQQYGSSLWPYCICCCFRRILHSTNFQVRRDSFAVRAPLGHSCLKVQQRWIVIGNVSHRLLKLHQKVFIKNCIILKYDDWKVLFNAELPKCDVRTSTSPLSIRKNVPGVCLLANVEIRMHSRLPRIPNDSVGHTRANQGLIPRSFKSMLGQLLFHSLTSIWAPHQIDVDQRRVLYLPRQLSFFTLTHVTACHKNPCKCLHRVKVPLCW